MLYNAYEMQRSLLAGASTFAHMSAEILQNPANPLSYFGGGPMERFAVDGDSVQTDWSTGQPNLKGGFIACSDIQVVFGGVNVTTPSACAQTTFN